MIARLAGLFTICMLTTGAAMGPVLEITPARELQAASRLVRDGDLQGDWNKTARRARHDSNVWRRTATSPHSCTISWATSSGGCRRSST